MIVGPLERAHFTAGGLVAAWGPRRRSLLSRIFDWRRGKRPWHSHATGAMVTGRVTEVDEANSTITVTWA